MSKNGTRGERRAEPRWHDKRLVLLCTEVAELPGVTGDISAGGMAVGLPGVGAKVGSEVTAVVAFAQELVEVRGQIVHVQQRETGVCAGICLGADQDRFSRFVQRRYSEHRARGQYIQI